MGKRGLGANAGNQNVFRILRFFSVTSLISILVAAALLTLLYRQVAINDLLHFGERGNQLLAQSFLNAVRAPLVVYLANEDHHHGRPVPSELVQAITGLMQNTGVTRVKIYDDEGIVLFSTKSDQIGKNRSGNPGFQSGMKGRVMSDLIYRDKLNPFDRESESDNLIQTYIPIRQGHDEAILGVFEVYSDLTPLVAGIERAQILILGGSTGILVLLYLALLAIVRYAERIIVTQQNTIRDRNHALELLSAQLIRGQEDEKKHLAFELHEGIAQNLSSIKYRMEHACRPNGLPCADDNRPLEAIVPAIQSAIQEVRALAMDLRPSSLDDLGLLPTLEWYCREFRAIYPGIDLQLDVQTREEDIPKNLKEVLFRLIQQMLQNIAREGCANQARIRLHRSDASIRLELRDNCPAAAASDEQATERNTYLLTLRERVTLAGGDMDVFAPDESGGTTVSAGWWI
jgi:signal transduction histidine kinase